MVDKNAILDNVKTDALLNRAIVDWKPILAQECGVYVCGEQYLGKRYDQINYLFCEQDTAKEILVDNLYAILKFKYFPKITDAIEEKIDEIVKSFCRNLKTSLIKVGFDTDTECTPVSFLPDGCVAFRNGVYNFRENDWLFKYEKIRIANLTNTLYIYNNKYIITWYMNFDFEPLPIDINDLSLEEFIEYMKVYDQEDQNLCFELMYNIAHDYTNKFDIKRFTHLCEIIGYLCLQSFSQNFVMLVGSGQNGKNSLLDGCFTNKVLPAPANNDMDAIENDRFITGALENKSQNIFLETSPKTYTQSKMIKAITGSMNQTIESKGISKYSGIINCKYVFSANDQDKLKFSDNTIGFRRRINIFEIWYHWDPQLRFMREGDYYETTFSDSLIEIKGNIMNTLIFIYFAMYGIKNGTDNFKKNFKFTYNDWNSQYTDIDWDLQEAIEKIDLDKIVMFMKKPLNDGLGRIMFVDEDGVKLQDSYTIKEYGYYNYDDMLKLFSNEDTSISFFGENKVYMCVPCLQRLLNDVSPAASFTSNLKKIYNINKTGSFNNKKTYVKVTFKNRKLRIVQQ